MTATDPLRIGFDYTPALHQQAGIGRYARSLLNALAALSGDTHWHLFAAGAASLSPNLPANTSLHPSRLSERTHNRLWHRLRMPVAIERWTGDIDLYHATDFNLPPTRPTTRAVVTIHDLAYERYPEQTMPGMQQYLSQTVPRSVARADHVIAVSQATKDDLFTLYDTPTEKISVVPHGVEPYFNPQPDITRRAALRHRFNLVENTRIVLSVGTLQPRKNQQRLVEAFASLKMDAVLLLAGSPGWSNEGVYDAIRSYGLDNRVIITGHLHDDDLPELYRMADVMAYPAIYEGFGLPVLEAMASGTPVLTSADFVSTRSRR